MAGTRRVHPDVVVENHGSLFLFWVNETAAEWVRENVQIPDYMWRGDNGFACQHEHADQLTAGLQEAGFTVKEG